MPSYRIVFIRKPAGTAETITAAFDTLEQALDVFAARDLEILYIAEREPHPRTGQSRWSAIAEPPNDLGRAIPAHS